MTFNEIVMMVKDYFKGRKAENNNQHFVTEVTITDAGKGVFYIEFDNEKINVEPNSYPQKRDVHFTTDAQTFIDIVNGKLDPQKAFTSGKLKIDCLPFSLGKVNQFISIYGKVK